MLLQHQHKMASDDMKILNNKRSDSNGTSSVRISKIDKVSTKIGNGEIIRNEGTMVMITDVKYCIDASMLISGTILASVQSKPFAVITVANHGMKINEDEMKGEMNLGETSCKYPEDF